MSGGTLNKVILIGNLGDEVKTHYFEDGNCVGRFSLATNESFLNKQTGEKVTTTEWHNIVVRNKLAEICEQYLVKGDKVYCEGKIKTRDLEGKTIVEIHVREMNFLSPKKENNTATNTKKNIASQGIIEDLPF